MQVWVKNRLVGHFNVRPPDSAAYHEIHFMAEPEEHTPFASCPSPVAATVKVERIRLQIEKRACEIDELAMQQTALPDLLRASKVGENFEEESVPNRYVRRFRWKVFTLSIDDYERIFDMQEFEPV